MLIGIANAENGDELRVLRVENMEIVKDNVAVPKNSRQM